MSSSIWTVALALLVACSGNRASEGDARPAPSQAPAADPRPGDAGPTPAVDAKPARAAEALAAAATALIEAGDARRLAHPWGTDEREDWHYVPRSRAGLALGDMSASQRQATHALIGAGLSPRGHEKVRGILLIEPILGRLEGNPDFRDPGRYHVAIFGQPGARSTWGWRVEGHHLSLNFTHAGGRIATTPSFLGANPARVPGGKHAGLRVLGDEEDLGRALLASLTDEQRGRAVIAGSAPADLVTEASRRVRLSGFEGLPAADMSAAQRAALLRLIEVYASTFQPGLAKGHMDRIAAGVERIHFAWAGSAAPGKSHYYRVHGPTHLIEYDNRGGDHIHTVFRDLEHDFGDGLLARHLREHHRRHARVRTRAAAGPASR